MATVKRGRPQKTNNTVTISELEVEFLSKKENDYKAVICYFKVTDPQGKKKMKPITCLADDDIRMPYWVTDKNEIILKCKDKFIGNMSEFTKTKRYTVDLEFESYCIDKEGSEPLKGYYMKVPTANAIEGGFEVEVADN